MPVILWSFCFYFTPISANIIQTIIRQLTDVYRALVKQLSGSHKIVILCFIAQPMGVKALSVLLYFFSLYFLVLKRRDHVVMWLSRTFVFLFFSHEYFRLPPETMWVGGWYIIT